MTPVLASLPEIRELVDQKGLPEGTLRDGVIVVERRWVAESLPESELLTALAYAFTLLATIVLDADVRFSAAQIEPPIDPVDIGAGTSPYPHRLRPPCMVASHEARTSHFRYSDGSGEVGGMAAPVARDGEGYRRAIQRYGAPARPRDARSALDWVDTYVTNARSILETGDEHGWFVLYFRGGTTVHSEALAARDKADKWTLAQHVANMADRLDADGVIQIGEVWIGTLPKDGAPYLPAGDQPNRREGVAIHAATSSGATRTVLIPFRRSAAFGFVEVGEPEEPEHDQMLFFAALHAMWGTQRSPEVQDRP